MYSILYTRGKSFNSISWCCGSDLVFQCGSGFKELRTKSFTILIVKKIHIFLVKNCNSIICRPPWRSSSYRRSLQPSKEKYSTSKNFIFFLCGSFLRSWIRICIEKCGLDPDPADQNQCGSGSGSTTLLIFQYISTSKLIYHGLSNYGYTMIYIILSELVHLHKKIILYLYKYKQFNFILCVVWLMLEGRLILALWCQSWSSFQLYT